MNVHAYFVLLIELANFANFHLEAMCPKSTNYVRRLGKTKYYILHGPNRDNFLSKYEAKVECKRHGLKLAKVRNMVSMALVGRELEKLGYKHKLRDTWYWIDAVFDKSSQMYYWGDPKNGDVVKYSNIFYRPPRPIGIGAHISYKGEYQKNLTLEQCLTLSLPWPWPEEGNMTTVYGFQTMFDERHCKSRKSRHALCESPVAACASEPRSPFHLSEEKLYYFEDGHWIVGRRRYILNWKQRTFNETSEYCKSINLQILTPGDTEKFLIPYIKMWARSITTALFWTNLRYNASSMQFLDIRGNALANSSLRVNFTEDTDILQGRSSVEDTIFCVALSLSYEMKSQMPCPQNENKTCSWSFIKYVPSNCKNFHGSICQHYDYGRREIKWKKIDPKNLTEPLREDTVLTFGYENNMVNSAIRRSKVKQTFGLCYCSPTFRMMRMIDRLPDWGKKPRYSYNTYDYLDTYWVVDEEGFNKTESSNCTVAYVDPDNMFERKFKKVPCTDWHFYLCIYMDTKEVNLVKNTANFRNSTAMEWREGPQSRIYPVLVEPDTGNGTQN